MRVRYRSVIDYVEIPVSDLDRAHAHYANVLRPFGFRRLHHDQSGAWWQVGSDVFCLRHHPPVVASARADRPGVIAFCLEDRASVDQAFALVGEAGWSIVSARQESRHPRGCYGFEGRDLDENHISFYTRWFDLPDLAGAECTCSHDTGHMWEANSPHLLHRL